MERILNCLPSPNTALDWKFEHAIDANIIKAAVNLPPKVDWRASWWTIGDQGRTGACVGWAVADSVLRWHFAQEDRISKKDLLAVRYVWMAAKETDEFISRPTSFVEADGTSLKAALDVVRNFGVVTDDVLPISKGVMFPGDTKTFYAIASRLKIANYINLDRDLMKWRSWLADNGPILARLNVDRPFMQLGADGVLQTYLADTALGGHAIALVGYTPDGFIVRNSWGTDWGDQGFAYASNEYAQAAFTEAYGVTL